MSGAQVSSFGNASQNSLFDPLMSRRQTALDSANQNALLEQQQHQQAIGAQELEVGARVASALLNFGTEEERAAAYPRMVGVAQAQGYLKNAPSIYPGEAQTRALAQMGVPSADLYKEQGNRAAAAGYGRSLGIDATPGAAAAPGAGTGTAARPPLTPFRATNLPAGVTPEEDQMVRTVIGEAGGEPLAGQQAVAHVIKTRARLGNQDTQSVIFAPNQFEPWNNPETRARLEAIDPASPQYQQILNTVVRPVVAGQVADPTGGATHFFSPTAQAALGRQPPGWSQGGNRTTIGRHEFYYPGYAPPSQQATAAPVAAPGGAPVQVAAATPTTATDGTTAPVAAPAATPAPTVQAAPPAAPAPFVSKLPPLQRSGLTTEQEARVNQRLQTRGADINAIDDDVRAMQTANTAERHQEQADFNKAQQEAAAAADRTAHLTLAQQAADALAAQRKQENERAARAADQAAQAAERAAEELRLHQQSAAAAQRLAAAAGDPHLAVMMEIGPEIENGTATDARRAAYEGAYQKFIANKAVETQDPEHPDRRISVVPPESIPTMFPPPNYRPGASSNWVKGQPLPPAVKPPPPLQDTEVEKLTTTTNNLDVVRDLNQRFKPEYGGFIAGSVGDAWNAIARATGDSPRASWWQDYQRTKLPDRQKIIGATMTSAEQAEYEKADINPGMSGATIAANLKRQQIVLESAIRRRVETLKAGGYNPAQIEAATKPSTLTQPAVPEIGTIKKGYRFNGGDPSDPTSWQKVE